MTADLALAANQHLPGSPVDVLEPDCNHFLRTKAKPSHHQQHRVVAATDPIVAANRIDQPPDVGRLQMPRQGTGTRLGNPRYAERQVMLDPAGREQEAEHAAQTPCLVVEAGPARCRLWLVKECDNVIVRESVQVAGRGTETEGREALQDPLTNRNGLRTQSPLVMQPVAVREAQLIERTPCRRCGGRSCRHHASIDEMRDETLDVFLPLLRRGKLSTDLADVETAGLNPGTEPVDRALVVADCPCRVAELGEFRQERVTVEALAL